MDSLDGLSLRRSTLASACLLLAQQAACGKSPCHEAPCYELPCDTDELNECLHDCPGLD